MLPVGALHWDGPRHPKWYISRTVLWIFLLRFLSMWEAPLPHLNCGHYDGTDVTWLRITWICVYKGLTLVRGMMEVLSKCQLSMVVMTILINPYWLTLMFITLVPSFFLTACSLDSHGSFSLCHTAFLWYLPPLLCHLFSVLVRISSCLSWTSPGLVFT